GPSIAGSMVPARTLPRCHRLSSSTRCLIATWAPTWRCCILQPPQAPSCRPKCGQRGRTRCGDSRWIVVTVACSQLFFLRFTLADTHSNGSAPSMNTTLPSALRATPCASMSSESTSSQPSGRLAFFPASSVMPELSLSAPGSQVLLPMRLQRCEIAQRRLDHGDLLLVFGLGQAGAHLLEPAVQQIRVHHVGFAIAPDVLELAFEECRIDLRPVHAELAGKTAEFRHGIERRIVLGLIHGEEVHQVQMTRVIAADVVVPLEFARVAAAFLPHAPVLVRDDAVLQAAIVQDRQVETAAVPAHQLGHVLFEGIEKRLDHLAFAGVVTVNE